MTPRGAVPAMLVAFALAACSRPEPSPDYAAAREKHAALLAEHPGDAAARPEMDEVLRLLRAVPEQSADGPAARSLSERLLAERSALAEEASRRDALLAKAAAAPDWPTTAGSEAATAARIRITPGMTADELLALHGECLERAPGEYRLAVEAGGEPRVVEGWVVRADEECRERYASQVDQLVLVAGGAVVGVRPASEAKPVTEERVVRHRVEREVELVPLADGKWGTRGADGKVEPLPPGAEVRSLDGKPLPPPPSVETR